MTAAPAQLSQSALLASDPVLPWQRESNHASGHCEWRPVIRAPSDLRLHPAVLKLNLGDTLEDLNTYLLRVTTPEPVRISTTGIVLTGMGSWHKSVLDGRSAVECMERSFSDEDALQFILDQHRPSKGWNDFQRISLALTLRGFFQQKALANQRLGGKLKGLANLPRAEQIDVRREIARVAGTGPRNVAKVESILRCADQAVIEALRRGAVSIHQAEQWSKLPKLDQMVNLALHHEDRLMSKVVRRTVVQSQLDSLSADAVLDLLRTSEAAQPGFVKIQLGHVKQPIVIVRAADLSAVNLQRRLDLK